MAAGSQNASIVWLAVQICGAANGVALLSFTNSFNFVLVGRYDNGPFRAVENHRCPVRKIQSTWVNAGYRRYIERTCQDRNMRSRTAKCGTEATHARPVETGSITGAEIFSDEDRVRRNFRQGAVLTAGESLKHSLANIP